MNGADDPSNMDAAPNSSPSGVTPSPAVASDGFEVPPPPTPAPTAVDMDIDALVATAARRIAERIGSPPPQAVEIREAETAEAVSEAAEETMAGAGDEPPGEVPAGPDVADQNLVDHDLEDRDLAGHDSVIPTPDSGEDAAERASEPEPEPAPEPAASPAPDQAPAPSTALQSVSAGPAPEASPAPMPEPATEPFDGPFEEPQPLPPPEDPSPSVPAPQPASASPTGDIGEPPPVQHAAVSASEAPPLPPPDAVAAPAPPASAWSWRRLVRLAGLAVAAYFAFVFALILIYRFINPPATTLIAYQWLTGTKIEQTWVPIEDISPNLLRAVVVSEDWGFCDHYGVDLVAIERALEQAGEGSVPRGASTISMQVIKNLFLSQSKSYLRKAAEIPLTVVAEAVWPKSRMLEIYLNIAEWGPGIFGAEAAARHHFSKPASRLSEREAALLAAALPNPILRDAGDPSTRTARKASVIQSRMRAAGPVADCAMPQRAEKRGSGWETTVKKRAGAVPGL